MIFNIIRILVTITRKAIFGRFTKFIFIEVIDIPLTIPVVFIGAIIAQGSFAAVLLLIHQNNRKSNRFLGLLLLCFALWLLDDFFNAAYIYQQKPNLYFLPIYFSFAFGPLIYFYTKSITQSTFTFSKKHLWHFIPVILQFFFYIFLQSRDYEFRRLFWQEVHFPYTYNIEFVGSLFSLMAYLILSINLVRNYQKWINNQFSEISKINLNWLKVVQGVLIAISFLWIIDTVLRLIWQYYPKHDFSAIAMGVSVLVLASGALLQANLKKITYDAQIEKKLSGFEMNIDPMLIEKIKTKMQEQKYYLNPNLTLKLFAKNLNEPARRVSYHINHGLEKPFIDFVNMYRVDEFKSKIEAGKSKHLTLAGIAFDSGFSSKSTFNRVFKKMTGQSPSDFQINAQNKY